MRTTASALLAVLLASTALSALAPTASADTRLVVYCDPGNCPGVALGDRDDACQTGGVVGPCLYTGPGTGVGVWTSLTLCDTAHCVDLRVVHGCGAGVGVHYGTNAGQGTVCSVCPSPNVLLRVLDSIVYSSQVRSAVVGGFGTLNGVTC